MFFLPLYNFSFFITGKYKKYSLNKPLLGQILVLFWIILLDNGMIWRNNRVMYMFYLCTRLVDVLANSFSRFKIDSLKK